VRRETLGLNWPWPAWKESPRAGARLQLVFGETTNVLVIVRR
jgi:hypothetical protein